MLGIYEVALEVLCNAKSHSNPKTHLDAVKQKALELHNIMFLSTSIKGKNVQALQL